MVLVLVQRCEQWKNMKGCLGYFLGWKTTQLYGDYFINHYTDPYSSSRIQWKVGGFFGPWLMCFYPKLRCAWIPPFGPALFFLDDDLHKIWHTNGRCLDMLLRMFVSAEIFACWKVELWTLGGWNFLLSMGVNPKIGVPKMDGENNGSKPY